MLYSGRRPPTWLAAILPFFLMGIVLGSPPAKSARIPEASTQLKKAVKNFLRAKSFALRTSVTGGLSEDPAHRVTTVTVKKGYRSLVAGRPIRIMKISDIRAYKTPKAGKGSIYYQGAWVRLLSLEEGVLADRLVKFPAELLATAAKYRKTARWLKPSEIVGGKELLPGLTSGGGDVDEDRDKGSDEDGATRGKTVVRGSKKKETASMPRVLRVTAPEEVALNVFNTQVVNSGCMREG